MDHGPAVSLITAMAHLFTFRTARFDVREEDPNPINPIPGQGVLRWLRPSSPADTARLRNLLRRTGGGTSTWSVKAPVTWSAPARTLTARPLRSSGWSKWT